ncbi:hypothetical protein HWV62_594 [Athelia sp. TMB]|nr:hypothetical protein HWV62_594 [Athelia sp. TMB]
MPQIGAAIMDVAYGIKAVDNDPLIKLVDDGNHYTADASVPGRYLVETLTWLKYIPAWVPGASFKRKAAEAKTLLKDVGSVPFQIVKRAILLKETLQAEGTASPSFVTNCLQNIDTTGDVQHQEALIEESAGVMFTTSTLSTFILAMMKHPEVQAKAQLELDTVLGPGQLPSFGDEEAMPYVAAVVKECLRWEVVTPFAVPHQSTADDEYKGFHIPAGTLVIPNSWAVLNDEKMYPDPFTFNPDRFIKNGKLDLSVRDPEAAFGYGRRICPGQHMARGTIWINVACILACFTIQKPVDAQGKEFEPPVEYIAKIAPGAL